MSDSFLSAFSQSLTSQPRSCPHRRQRHHHQLLPLLATLIPTPTTAASISTSIRTSQFQRHSQKYATLAATACSSVEKDYSSSFLVGDDEEDAPASIELIPVTSEEQFDRIIAEAQQLEESIVVLWMANWCRKCIYLKPKLEKLAADYHPRIRFYCVDVNIVPQKLVSRAGITKMPTIQLWKDSQKQAEVIGGHKAWLVVDDVRRMIENED